MLEINVSATPFFISNEKWNKIDSFKNVLPTMNVNLRDSKEYIFKCISSILK